MKKSKGIKGKRLRVMAFLAVLGAHFVVTTGSVCAKMYLWKNEQGVFNASEQRPSWWPRDSSCIVWVPGRRKVADLVQTKENMAACEVEVEKKKKAAKRARTTGTRTHSSPKKVTEPTEKEMRIYCTYRKSLMKFIDARNPEDLAADYVCIRFKISRDEFATIYSKVLEYKGGETDCFY